MNIYGVRAELRMCSSEQKAQGLRKFFKTGPGEYGEGDVFIGVKVPELRMIARECGELDEEDVIGLFHSKIHEERMLALIILVGRFEKGDKKIRKKIYKMYLENARYVNNWDLVDISAHKIVGAYLMNKSKRILKKLVRSKLLWERRIAIVSTFWFIKNDSFDETLMLSKMLINDSKILCTRLLDGCFVRLAIEACAGKRNFSKNITK